MVDLKAVGKWDMLIDVWMRMWKCREVMSNVFFSVILAISSGPGAFLGEILSMARRT